MGPQLFSCGDMSKLGQTHTIVIKLQWGHNFSVVEIAYRNANGDTVTVLQWGHNFSVVEIGMSGNHP